MVRIDSRLKELSVIIINYKSTSEILDCLNSAFQFSSAGAFEWIVINNDPSDQSAKEEVITKYPGVRWVDMAYNAGFARANNRGIGESSGEIVLLLNPDTIILDDAIQKCFERLKHSEYVAASVQLQDKDGTKQITGNFYMTGGLNHLLPLPYIGPVLRRIALAAGTKKTNIQSASADEKVDWLSGAFLMVKKAVIKKAGLMDEDFFLYSEETEWCSRLGKYGELHVFGDLSTIHLQGASINEATRQPEKGYADLTGKRGRQLIVSQHLRIRKQFGSAWFLFHLMIFTIEVPVFFVFSLFENIFMLRNPFADWGKALSYTGNIITLWKLTPRIISNKSYFYKMF